MDQDEYETLKLHRRIRTGLIARLNDAFRTGGDEKFMSLTTTVSLLPESEKILDQVRTYRDFANPNSEHDIGTFDWFGTTLIWKIYCYDHNGVWIGWVEPERRDCVRTLMVMRADEF